jgi:hypothetical protein
MARAAEFVVDDLGDDAIDDIDTLDDVMKP